MAEYRHSAHAVFDLKYHLVWCTKYRYKILRGRVAERARDLIRQICQGREVTIIRGAVAPDHIHMLLFGTTSSSTREIGTVHQGTIQSASAGRISRTAQTVLGTTPVGARILLRDGGRGG